MAEKINKYYLGCPVWSNRDWVGEFFTADAKTPQFLGQYASVYTTVEGNNTFYGLPKPQTVERWRDETPEHFRFCFKFPQKVSHMQMLVNAEDDVQFFFDLMAPLQEKIGQYFLQLPPSFGKLWLPALAQFLENLPSDFSYALEVRNRDFFDEGDAEKRLNDLLAQHNINRALFDTETLHNIESNVPEVLEAQRKKPKMPPRFTTTATQPMLRFVGYNVVEPNLPRLAVLADHVAGWIKDGKTPYVFMHSPNDTFAPHLCREFHRLLGEHLSNDIIGEVPVWPVDIPPPEPAQLSLF